MSDGSGSDEHTPIAKFCWWKPLPSTPSFWLAQSWWKHIVQTQGFHQRKWVMETLCLRIWRCDVLMELSSIDSSSTRVINVNRNWGIFIGSWIFADGSALPSTCIVQATSIRHWLPLLLVNNVGSLFYGFSLGVGGRGADILLIMHLVIVLMTGNPTWTHKKRKKVR